MDMKLTLLRIILLSSLSATAYSNSLLLAKPVTHGEKGYISNPSVTSSNPSIATGSITGTTIVPGAHNLTISTLARAEQLSTLNNFVTTTTALGITETLTISVGSTEIKVDVRPSDSLKEIAVKINSAANAANLKAVAHILETGAKRNFLTISSAQTGRANIVRVSESAGDNILNISKELMAANDSRFVLDGLTYASPSNNNVIGDWLMINFLGLGDVVLTVIE